MDYQKILDEWAEIVTKKMDEATERSNTELFGSYKYTSNKHYADGLAMAMAILHRIEQKHKRRQTK
jgi:hypothetical protein